MTVTAHAMDWRHDSTDLSMMEHGQIVKRSINMFTLQPTTGGKGKGKGKGKRSRAETVVPQDLEPLALQDLELMVAGAIPHEDENHVGSDVAASTRHETDRGVIAAIQLMDSEDSPVAVVAKLAMHLEDGCAFEDASANVTDAGRCMDAEMDAALEQWCSTAHEFMMLLQDALHEVEGCLDPEDLCGGRRALNNVSLILLQVCQSISFIGPVARISEDNMCHSMIVVSSNVLSSTSARPRRGLLLHLVQ